MTDHLDAAAGSPGGWRRDLLDRAPWGLSAWYSTFLEAARLDDRYYVPAEMSLAGNSLWAADWDDWNPAESFTGDEAFLFSVVRPGQGVTAAAVADRLRPYL